jgi:hypothetical protein
MCWGPTAGPAQLHYAPVAVSRLGNFHQTVTTPLQLFLSCARRW